MTRQNTALAAVAAALIVVAWFFLLFSPKNDEVSVLHDEREQALTQQQTVQTRIAALEGIRSAAPEIEAGLAAARTLVPAQVALPTALRQLQHAADEAGLTLDSITPDRAGEVPGVEGVSQFGVTMTLQGSYFQLVDFTRRLEDPTLLGRAVLVEDVNVAIAEHPTLDATVRVRMFSTDARSPGQTQEPAGAAAAEGEG